MKILPLLAPLLLLTSCAVPIPDNDYVEGEVGKFKRTSPFDPDGRWGVLFTKPQIEVIPAK